jgi:hypothetical protein
MGGTGVDDGAAWAPRVEVAGAAVAVVAPPAVPGQRGWEGVWAERVTGPSRALGEEMGGDVSGGGRGRASGDAGCAG